MDVHVRRVAHEPLEGVERAHHGKGHHPLDESSQPDAGQRVGVYDGDFKRWWHHEKSAFGRKVTEIFLAMKRNKDLSYEKSLCYSILNVFKLRCVSS